MRYIPIDLDDSAAVAAAAVRIDADFGRLDMLINNAAIAAQGDGPPSAISLEAVERDFRVNFMGPVAVTQAMLRLLREAPSARIVNVSSGLGSLTKTGDPAFGSVANKYLGYAASKSALNMLTVQLAYELGNTAIKVNSAGPGYTATDLNGYRGRQSVAEGLWRLFAWRCSRTIVQAAVSPIEHGTVPW